MTFIASFAPLAALAPLGIGGLGPTELFVILGIVLLLFGSRKLPQLARSMGSSITSFKKGLKDDPDQIAAPKEGGEDEDVGSPKT